jgi:type IV secretory pathway TrbL component
MKLRYFYTWLFPAVWLVITIVSFNNTGDEHGCYAFATFPFTMPVAYIFNLFNFNLDGLAPLFYATLPLGIVVLALLGFAMDRLKINRFILLIYPVFFIILIWFVLNQYPSLEQLRHKHRSLLAPISAVAGVSLYVTIVFSFFAAFLIRIIKYFEDKQNVRTNPSQ